MGRIDLGGVQVRDKHVDLINFESSEMQWSKQHALHAAEIQIHYRLRELGR